MAETQYFSTPDGVDVAFDVSDSFGGSPALGEALRTVTAISTAVVEQIAQIPEHSTPEEIEMSFGLLANGQDGFVVTRGMEDAHLTLTMRFAGDVGREENELTPGV